VGYAAFISYSHALDGRLAPALQRGLQRFARRWHEMRALAVFRDETSLSTSPHLWQSIERALAEAEYFILLASPAAAQSVWVGREAAWWRANRPLDRLLIVLTEGELAWDPALGAFRQDGAAALPPSLDGAFADEPRFLDLRWARGSADLSLQHPRFKNAVADLAATLHGRPKDELLGEDVLLFRRQRLLRRAAVALLSVLTLAALAGGYIALERAEEAARQIALAEQRRQEAEAARNEAVANLTRAVETKLDITDASSRPDLSLALIYRLLTDPAFAISDAARAHYLALLPELIGAAQLYATAPSPQEEGAILLGDPPPEWFFATAAGLVGGVPHVFGTVQPSDWEQPADHAEVRDLLTAEVLGAAFAFGEGGVAPLARFLGDGLLLTEADGVRRVLRLIGGDRVEAGTLPPLPGKGTAQEASLARGGRYVVDASLRYDNDGPPRGPLPAGILWLDDGRYVPLPPGVSALELADLDDQRLLLLAPDGVTLLDARSGAVAKTLASPLGGPLAGAGILDENRLWLADRQELLVYDLAAGRESGRIRHQADAVVAVQGAPGSLVLIACGRPWRLLSGADLRESATLPAISCYEDSLTSPWRRIVTLLADRRTLAFSAPHPVDSGPALWLAPVEGDGAPRVLPVIFEFNELLADASQSWMLLDPGYSGSVAYIVPGSEALLRQARRTLGPLADRDLAALLAL
jgi:hypothetical protein